MATVDLATRSFILFTVIVREKNRSCRRRLRVPSRVLEKTYACVQEAQEIWVTNSGRYLKEDPKSSKMYNYTRAYVLHDVNPFRERTRTCKYREQKEIRDRSKYPPIRECFKYEQKAAETNQRVEARLHV